MGLQLCFVQTVVQVLKFPLLFCLYFFAVRFISTSFFKGQTSQEQCFTHYCHQSLRYGDVTSYTQTFVQFITMSEYFGCFHLFPPTTPSLHLHLYISRQLWLKRWLQTQVGVSRIFSYAHSLSSEHPDEQTQLNNHKWSKAKSKMPRSQAVLSVKSITVKGTAEWWMPAAGKTNNNSAFPHRSTPFIVRREEETIIGCEVRACSYWAYVVLCH